MTGMARIERTLAALPQVSLGDTPGPPLRTTGVVERLMHRSMAMPNGCWEWVGPGQNKGYGRISVNGRSTLTHRAAYESLVGVIPDGLQIDHLCRNRRCINPDHLETVTNRENSLRGSRCSDTECRNGHDRTAENTYIRPDGQRECRACASAVEASRPRRPYKPRVA